MNKEKTVELYIDNLMRGIIEIYSYQANDDTKQQLLEKFKQWSKLFHNQAKFTEFNQLTEELYENILEFRAWGCVKGELKEVENEKLIESLKQQISNLDEANKRLAEDLMKYKTPDQKKDFQGVK